MQLVQTCFTCMLRLPKKASHGQKDGYMPILPMPKCDKIVYCASLGMPTRARVHITSLKSIRNTFKKTGGTSSVSLLCYNLPLLLTHGQAIPRELYQFIVKFAMSPHCRCNGQRRNDEDLIAYTQRDECLAIDHPGIYRRRFDEKGIFQCHQCTLCKKKVPNSREKTSQNTMMSTFAHLAPTTFTNETP